MISFALTGSQVDGQASFRAAGPGHRRWDGCLHLGDDPVHRLLAGERQAERPIATNLNPGEIVVGNVYVKIAACLTEFRLRLIADLIRDVKLFCE